MNGSNQSFNILIVKLSALGDVVHALVASTIIKRKFPQSKLFWITNSEYIPLFKFVDFVDDVIPLSLREFRRLRDLDFSVVIDLQGLLKSSVFLPFLKAKKRVGFDPSEAKERLSSIFYNQRIKTEGKHIVEKLRELICEALCISDDGLFPSPFSGIDGESIEGYGLLFPSASWQTKILDTDWCLRFFSGCLKAGLNLDLLIGKNDYLRFRKFPFGSHILVGLSIEEALKVISKAEFVVGPDTGFLHIAASLGKKVFALYCPSDPIRNGPFVEEKRVFTCDCPNRGCYKRRCFKNCTSSIPLDKVLKEVAKNLLV